MFDLPRLPRPSAPLAAVLVAALGAVLLVPIPTTAHAAPRVQPPEIVPFDDWAPAECPRPTGEGAALVGRTVVHHTHEPVAHTPQDVVPALIQTCAAHTDRGFSTIGYHYVVDPWGGVYQGRGGLPGPDGSAPRGQMKGAHVAGSNTGAVGVVFLGDHAAAPPTVAALESATQLLAWLLDGAGLDPSTEVETVSTGKGTARHTGTFHPEALSGHSDSNHTECPGAHLRALLPELREHVRQVRAGGPAPSWDGLGLASAPGRRPVQPAEASAAKPVREAPAAESGRKAPAAKSAREALPPSSAAATADRPGPVASFGQRLARGLRAIGLDGLAGKVDPGA